MKPHPDESVLCLRSGRHLDAHLSTRPRLKSRVFVFKGLPPPGPPLQTRKYALEWVLEALPLP